MTDLLHNRDYLHKRHRLSHAQIDRWLGEKRSNEFVQEKMKRMEHVRQFLLITDKLRQQNIPFVCIKGPLLSLRLYGDPTIRLSHDVDLLIDKKHLDAAVKTMQAEGFDFAHDFIWPKERHRQELFLQSIHHLEFFNRKTLFCVEIHWVLSSQLAIPMQKVRKIMNENITTIPFSGRDFTVLNKEFELLYLLIHGARHGWKRLKWLIDINEYTKQKLDIELLERLIRLMKAGRIVGQTNYLLEKYFNNHLPVPCKKHANRIMIKYADKSINSEQEFIDYTSNVEIIKDKAYQWFIFSTLSYKCTFFPGIFVRSVDVRSKNFSNKISYVLYRPYSFLKRRILNG
nr:nucleotidyltransferase family protein [uncultured Draconibacterium sp.]